MNSKIRTDLRRAMRLAEELKAELTKREAEEVAKIDGFDATDALENIRTALGFACQAHETLYYAQP